MKQNNELLEYIYKTASMGYESTTNLLRALENKDNKLKKAIEDELRRNYIISDSKVFKTYCTLIVHFQKKSTRFFKFYFFNGITTKKQ